MAASLFDTIATNLKAGLGQVQDTYRDGWNAAAGGSKWDLLEKKASLAVAAPAWTAIKGGASPTHAGGLPIKAPTSPAKLLLLNARAMSRTQLTPTVRLLDVIGYANFNCTSTALQTFTGFTLPRWTNGECLQLYILARSAVGAAAPVATIKYTSNFGTINRTATVTLLASVAQGQIAHEEDFIALDTSSGVTDRGVLSVTSIQLSTSWLAGTAVLVLCKSLTTIEVPSTNRVGLRLLYSEGTPQLIDSQEAYINAQYVADAAGTPKVHYGTDICEA